jgi:hypothetical protein
MSAYSLTMEHGVSFSAQSYFDRLGNVFGRCDTESVGDECVDSIAVTAEEMTRSGGRGELGLIVVYEGGGVTVFAMVHTIRAGLCQLHRASQRVAFLSSTIVSNCSCWFQ